MNRKQAISKLSIIIDELAEVEDSCQEISQEPEVCKAALEAIVGSLNDLLDRLELEEVNQDPLRELRKNWLERKSG